MTRASFVNLTQVTAAPPGSESPSYDADVYSWAIAQADLLRQGRFHDADMHNIIEEIEALSRSEYNSLVSFLARAMQHLLKWDHQPTRRTRSSKSSIKAHQVQARQCLRQNPGLKGRLDEIMSDAYELAVAYALHETGLERESFPEVCPYDLETVMTRQVAE